MTELQRGCGSTEGQENIQPRPRSCSHTMSEETGHRAFPSGLTSSSQSESDEERYGSEDAPPYGFYSAGPFYDPYPQRTTQIVFEYRAGRKVARLRAPRDLYGVSSTSFFQLPRWPYECQVLKDRIEHIEWEPPFPEPMYKSTGLEQEPACADPLESKVIYQVDEGWKEPWFMCSRVGGTRTPLRTEHPHSYDKSDSTLVFESRFESGNLQKAVQVGEHDYQLTLRTDLYTSRHTQWYYFQVKNMRADVPYRFTIINFMKPTSLYNHGMRPLLYSEREATTRQMGWHRIGDEIKYYKNSFGQDGHYSLTWIFQFPHSGDTCYFAYCYPYTYSNLQDYLARVANNPKQSKYCKIRVLCHSLAGNIVFVLTITNPSPATVKPKKKKAVIVTARVHPGETNSSWVMKGFLDFILSSQTEAEQLRDAFVFKVVPMLNPDGVIVGNYRCSLTGRDLNRNYKSRLKDSFPSIWFTRNMIKRVMAEREVLLYCDLHGHSRKQNVFMYGCQGKGVQDGGRHLCGRLFPFMLSQNSPDKFSFSGCKFKVQKNKEGTGRVVMWKMGIQNSYTLEATFCGSTLGHRRRTHFSARDLESLGHQFCSVLLDYCNPDQTKYYACLRELEDVVMQKANHHLSVDSEAYLDVLSDLDSSTGVSNSSDSNGPPAHLMELAGKVKPRKKRLKSKRERNSQRARPELMCLPDPQDNGENAQRKERRDSEERPMNSVTVKIGSTEKQNHPRKGCKRENAPLPQQQGKPLLPDLDSGKVSVIYLVFNTSGEVITTKSHAYAGEQNMMKIAGSFNGFPWNQPLPVLRRFLPQKCPFSGILGPSCYYIIPTGISDTPLSNITSDESEIGSGEGRRAAVKLGASSLYNEARFPSSRCPWTGDLPPERVAGSSQLPDSVARHALLPPSMRTSGSAPLLAPVEVLNDQSANYMTHRHKDKCSSAPLNREDHGRSGRKKKDKTRLKDMKEEIVFPAVPNSKESKITGKDEQHFLHPADTTKIWQVQHVSPNSASRCHAPSSTNTSALLLRKGRSVNGTLHKRKLGGRLHPHPQEDQAMPMNTWKDILIGLEADGGGASKAGIPLSPSAPSEDLFIQRTNGFANRSRKLGQRVNLAPLSKQSPNFPDFCSNDS